MPQLADRHFEFYGKADGRISFKASVTVDSEGVFRVSVPDEFGDREDFRKFADSVGCSLEPYRKKWRVRSSTMQGIDEKMNKLFTGWLACETTSELVIHVHAIASCHYCKDTHGDVHPNGTLAREASGLPQDGLGWKWNETLRGRWMSSSDVSPDDYSVGVKAEVVEKLTHVRQGVKSVQYRKPEDCQLGEWGLKLNAFVRVRIPEDGRHEIPYTEEASRFFFQTMIGLCQLADRIAGFFGPGDFKSKFEELVASGSILALMPAEGDKNER